MKKLFTTLLTAALLTASAAAYAVNPGEYVNHQWAAGDGMEGFYGEIKLCRLEGDGRVPSFEIFGITTRDSIEPRVCYAGIINKNTPERATGTLMYKLTNNERTEAFSGKPQKGIWLADINSADSNISIDLKANTLVGLRKIEDTKLPIGDSENGLFTNAEYRYNGPKLDNNGDMAMKVVALAKLRSLLGERLNLKEESYKLVFLQKNNALVKVERAGKELTYMVNDNLCNIKALNNAGEQTTLLQVPEQTGPFGNAHCTGDEVLVRDDSSRTAQIVGILNNADKVICYRTEKGEKLEGNDLWYYVELPNGKQGYVYSSYIKYDD